MSILLIEVVPHGIVFGADKNITRTTGTQQATRYLGQYRRSKIVSWPRAKALAGYIGAAKVGGKPTDQWIHQGEDLPTFNPLEKFLKAAFKLLCRIYPQKHTFPKNVHDWERQVEMAIRTYAAYFQTYRAPNEQLVGGGVDTAPIPWPD